MLLWPWLAPGPIPRPLACLSFISLCAAVFGSWVRGPPIFFDPGCLGRPLWPADSGGPVGPSSLFSRVSSF